MPGEFSSRSVNREKSMSARSGSPCRMRASPQSRWRIAQRFPHEPPTQMKAVGFNPAAPDGSVMCRMIPTKVCGIWNSAALSAVTVPADILSTPTYLEFIQSRNSDFGECLPQIDQMRHTSRWTPSRKNTPLNASPPTSPAILQELNLRRPPRCQNVAANTETSEQSTGLELTSHPVWDGITVAQGRVYVSTMNGRVQCFGK